MFENWFSSRQMMLDMQRKVSYTGNLFTRPAFEHGEKSVDQKLISLDQILGRKVKPFLDWG
jgi:hypothetical protein